MPLTRWTHYRQTRAQKKKALYPLALSGVVRPGTTELRYTAPLSHTSAELSSDEQTPIAQDTSVPNPSALPMCLTGTTHLAHHFYTTTFTFLAKSRRHIRSLQWDTRNAA